MWKRSNSWICYRYCPVLTDGPSSLRAIGPLLCCVFRLHSQTWPPSWVTQATEGHSHARTFQMLIQSYIPVLTFLLFLVNRGGLGLSGPLRILADTDNLQTPLWNSSLTGHGLLVLFTGCIPWMKRVLGVRLPQAGVPLSCGHDPACCPLTLYFEGKSLQTLFSNVSGSLGLWARKQYGCFPSVRIIIWHILKIHETQPNQMKSPNRSQCSSPGPGVISLCELLVLGTGTDLLNSLL